MWSHYDTSWIQVYRLFIGHTNYINIYTFELLKFNQFCESFFENATIVKNLIIKIFQKISLKSRFV